MRLHKPSAAVMAALLTMPALCFGQMGPSTVMVAPVEARSVELTQPLVASLEPISRSTIASEQAGLIVERFFDEGQSIAAGHLLAKLKTDVLEAQIASARAAEASARAAVAKSQAEVANAKAKADRARKLYDSNALGGEELRDAETAEKVREAEVLLQSAIVTEKESEVRRLNLLLDKSSVKTPIPGVVTRRHVEAGQWIEQGAAVADIVWLHPIHVRVAVPESTLRYITADTTATVRVDALPGQTFTAKVDQIMPEADAASRAFVVKFKLDNPDGQLKPGYFARATLSAKSSEGLLVPKDAVVSDGNRARIVVARDGKAVVVPVTRGAAEAEKVVVLPPDPKSLSAGDLVVIRGNEGLRGGETLMVLNAPPPTAAAPTTMPATQPTAQPTPPG
jgi:RND family efflux transporter MFP subunit